MSAAWLKGRRTESALGQNCFWRVLARNSGPQAGGGDVEGPHGGVARGATDVSPLPLQQESGQGAARTCPSISGAARRAYDSGRKGVADRLGVELPPLYPPGPKVHQQEHNSR